MPMTLLDAHKAVAWDLASDRMRLYLFPHRDILETNALSVSEDVSVALAGANQVTGQERLEIRYPELHLLFLGFSDFCGGGRVAELKVKSSAVYANAKSGCHGFD